MRCPICYIPKNEFNSYHWNCYSCGTRLKWGMDTIFLLVANILYIFFYVLIVFKDPELHNRYMYLVLPPAVAFIGSYLRKYGLGEVVSKNKKNTNNHKNNDEEESKNYYGGDDSTISKEKSYGIVLGLKGKVSLNDIKKAYQIKIKEYHPDKVASMGEDIKKLAEEETKKINEAYSYFLKKYKVH
jgi:hypothetical protein